MSRLLGRQRSMFPRNVFALSASIAFTLMQHGCDEFDVDNPQPLRTSLSFGVAGQALGQFNYPRAIDVDASNHLVYVVDKQARVQRFDFEGVPQLEWKMPEYENGKPTGVSVAADGRVFVPDTHYHRVIAYDKDGTELFRFGEYGTGPGQFIYLTDVAFGPNATIYVSEYGGNDRIQVFDSTGKFLFQFGTFGDGDNQFNRPQSITFNRDMTELYVADACNHRIVVVDPNGQFLRKFGAPGHEVGQLSYPYGIEILDDETLLVAEFGNNRIQRFDSAGQSLGAYGRTGRGEGELHHPWALALADDRVFVLDSGNNRVQVIRNPS